MKRLLSVLLVLTMLLTSCFFFASCAKVKTQDFEKDAYSALQDVSNKTYEEFLSDEAGMNGVIKDALKSGSVAVVFEGGEELLGVDLKVGETIYFDAANKKYVSDTSVKFGEESLAARLFVDKNGIAINGEDVLGSNKTIAINFATLAEQFAESALSDLIFGGFAPEETVAEVTEVLNLLKAEYEKLFANDADDKYKEFFNEICKLMKMTVSEEKVELADGKTANCVVVAYVIDNDVIDAIMDKVIGDMELPEDIKAETEAAIDEMLTSVDAYDIDISEKLYVNKKTGKSVKTTVAATVKEGETKVLAFDATVTFADTEIKATFTAETPEEKFNGDLTLTKEEKDGKTAYKLAINAGDGKGANVNLLNASYTYDKSSGAIALSIDVYGEEERTALTINGSINVTKDSAKVEITSVTVAGETYEFKLSVTFTKSAEIPALPSDAKDIVTLTQEDWMEILQEVSTSKIFSIFGAFEAPEDDYMPY